MNNLEDLKKFVISEMKSKNSEWNYFGTYDNHFRYESKYISVFKKNKNSIDDSFIRFNTNNEKIYIKTFGLSEIRFDLLITFFIKRFCKHSDKIKHEKHVKYIWDDFLTKNKDLNRDRKLEELGIHDDK